MNPYTELVLTYARLAKEGKNFPLGTFPKKTRTAPPSSAKTALIFSPHPDDEVIIGALALRLLRQAHWRVIDVAVTLGSSLERRPGRMSELKECCEYIGFEMQSVVPNGLENINPAGQKGSPSWAPAVANVASVLKQHNPNVVLFPHDADWNTTHIGTHLLLVDALKTMPEDFSCFVVETEYWAPMSTPNLMVEVSEEDLSDLVTALSFHVGEVQRNPYHLSLPAWMVDNVRRGGELINSQGKPAPDFAFSTLYRVRKWEKGQLVETKLPTHILSSAENPESLFS